MTILVIGSRPNSLGSAVTDHARRRAFKVVTAGVSGEERWVDVTDPASVRDLMKRIRPHQVVVTAGINQSFSLRAEGMRGALHEHLAVNTIGVLTALQEWLLMLEMVDDVLPKISTFGGPRQFVAISSNSAHIARRNSIPYCASKAALSMAIRCAARETAEDGVLVYGYEPGLLAGTPMTADAAQQFPGQLHRMYGVKPDGLSAKDMAATIVTNLQHPNQALHGAMLRLDAGEQ